MASSDISQNVDRNREMRVLKDQMILGASTLGNFTRTNGNSTDNGEDFPEEYWSFIMFLVLVLILFSTFNVFLKLIKLTKSLEKVLKKSKISKQVPEIEVIENKDDLN